MIILIILLGLLVVLASVAVSAIFAKWVVETPPGDNCMVVAELAIRLSERAIAERDHFLEFCKPCGSD